MATYVYESIPQEPGKKSVRFEVRQSMNDAALTNHPETGEPVRRVIVGGFGYAKKASSRASVPAQSHSCPAGGCGCR